MTKPVPVDSKRLDWPRLVANAINSLLQPRLGEVRYEGGVLQRAVLTSPFHIGVKCLRLWGRKGWLRLLPHWTFCGVEDGLVILELKNEE
jgi:hypothetical protein